MPRGYTLTDRALHGLLACSDADLRRLLNAMDHIANEDVAVDSLIVSVDRQRQLLIRGVGQFVILYRPPAQGRPPHILDIRQF